MFIFLVLENCAKYFLDPELEPKLEPEPKPFPNSEPGTGTANKSLRFHNTAYWGSGYTGIYGKIVRVVPYLASSVMCPSLVKASGIFSYDDILCV
jgi:hypothetical protein